MGADDLSERVRAQRSLGTLRRVAQHEYRPALDGVRALAVLGVIAYHVSGGKRGGFLGVDVFFVLSGYLITSLLLEERSATGTVRLGRFWARRARRLLPALLIVLLTCALVIHESESVSVWAQRRGDLLATLFYVANWHFIVTDQSYFTQYAGATPLRHMWSLGIEEQFYLVWPLLLAGIAVAVRRRPAALVAVLLGGAAVSAVALAALYDEANPSRAYFGTDGRAHELLLGAALAALVATRPTALTSDRAQRAARLAAPLLVAALGITVLLANDQTPLYYFGGSLLFAAGVAGVLWAVEAQPRGAVAALLSFAPLVWIGRISYGLYLWHWPMVIWIPTTDRLATLPPRALQLIEIGATFALATVSFYLVEQPIRRGRVPWLGLSTRKLALVAPLALAGVALAAATATSLQTAAPEARAIGDISDSPCPNASRAIGEYAWCTRVAAAAPGAPVVVAAGDSTSRALDPGLRVVARERGWRYVQAGQGGCSIAPLLLPLDAARRNIALARPCLRAIPRLLRRVRSSYRPDVWIVVDAVLRRPLLVGRTLLQVGDPRRRAPIRRALRATLTELTAGGAQAVVLGSVPPAQPLECATKNPRARECADPQHRARWAPVAEVNGDLRAAVRALGKRAAFVSIEDVMCPRGGVCPALVDGKLARYDGEHFTGSFSRRIVPEIIARAERAGVRFTHGVQ
jgi:peptidoglycan/LPS O-acetylase OafA/YrhL